jgi:prepilin-type N-terminal cleavage/methylation domain-containing protein
VKNQGFTLIELLISVALVAVLLTGITGLAPTFVAHIKANQAKQDELESIYTALHLLHQDSMMYYEDFTGSVNNVTMLTVQKPLIAETERSGQARIGYRIAQGKNGEDILYRSIKDNLISTTGVETEILRAPEITFSFLAENLSEIPVWQSSVKREAPVAWKINIQDSAAREWQRTLPLMVRFNDA